MACKSCVLVGSPSQRFSSERQQYQLIYSLLQLLVGFAALDRVFLTARSQQTSSDDD